VEGAGGDRRRRQVGRLLANHPDHGVDRHCLAFRRPNLEKDTRGRRWDFGIDLVSGDLEQGLVALDLVADALDPSDDGSFGDGLAHLRHYDIGRHDIRLQCSGVGLWALGFRACLSLPSGCCQLPAATCAA
jgi:hypothetical protein